MQYRILVDLSGFPRSLGISALPGISEAAIGKLIAAGCIAPLTAPPLAIFEGWEARAKRLEKQGITDALQLLEADPVDLARRLRVKATVIVDWQSEIKTWLMPQGE